MALKTFDDCTTSVAGTKSAKPVSRTESSLLIVMACLITLGIGWSLFQISY